MVRKKLQRRKMADADKNIDVKIIESKYLEMAVSSSAKYLEMHRDVATASVHDKSKMINDMTHCSQLVTADVENSIDIIKVENNDTDMAIADIAEYAEIDNTEDIASNSNAKNLTKKSWDWLLPSSSGNRSKRNDVATTSVGKAKALSKQRGPKNRNITNQRKTVRNKLATITDKKSILNWINSSNNEALQINAAAATTEVDYANTVEAIELLNIDSPVGSNNEQLENVESIAVESNDDSETSENLLTPNKSKQKKRYNRGGKKSTQSKEVLDKMHESHQLFGTNKKYVISTYHRKQVIDYLSKNGFSPMSLKKATYRFKVPTVIFAEWLEKKCDRDQRRIEQLYATDRFFQAIQANYENAKANHADKLEDNTQSLAMKLLADNLQHPDPAEIGGLDLGAIYNWMAEAMSGAPIVTQLNDVSTAFLVQEFEKLKKEEMDKLVTEEGSVNVANDSL